MRFGYRFSAEAWHTALTNNEQRGWRKSAPGPGQALSNARRCLATGLKQPTKTFSDGQHAPINSTVDAGKAAAPPTREVTLARTHIESARNRRRQISSSPRVTQSRIAPIRNKAYTHERPLGPHKQPQSAPVQNYRERGSGNGYRPHSPGCIHSANPSK